VDAIHEGLHVSVTVGKFLGIEGPIADVILPSIVEGDPGEAQTLHGWERFVDLPGLNRAAVAPRAPDRAEGIVGR